MTDEKNEEKRDGDVSDAEYELIPRLSEDPKADAALAKAISSIVAQAVKLDVYRRGKLIDVIAALDDREHPNDRLWRKLEGLLPMAMSLVVPHQHPPPGPPPPQGPRIQPNVRVTPDGGISFYLNDREMLHVSAANYAAMVESAKNPPPPPPAPGEVGHG